MYRTLKILFVILLVLTITEAGYYIYVLKYPIKPAQNNPSLAPSISSDQKIDRSAYLFDQITASDPYQFVKHFGMNDNQNLYLILEQKGIAQIDKSDDGKDIYLTIQNDQHKKIVSINIVNSLKITKIVKGEKTPISKDQIKTGDNILYTLKGDLVDQKKSSGEITIL